MTIVNPNVRRRESASGKPLEEDDLAKYELLLQQNHNGQFPDDLRNLLIILITLILRKYLVPQKPQFSNSVNSSFLEEGAFC